MKLGKSSTKLNKMLLGKGGLTIALWGLSSLAIVVSLIRIVRRSVDYYKSGGLWYDELFSIWATNPRLSPWHMQITNLAHETNPPLHFWLLNIFRHVLLDGRLAGTYLNVIILAFGMVVCFWLTWRRGLGIFALFPVFVLSSHSAIYINLQEVRPYIVAIACCSALATHTFLLRYDLRPTRKDFLILGALSASAALSHVYAAILAFSLAAALFVDGKRQAAIVLAGGAAVAFGAWFSWLLIISHGHLGNIGWIPLSLNSVFDTLNHVSIQFFLNKFLFMALILINLAGLACKSTRRDAQFLLISSYLFFVIPLAASLKTPIFYFRYFAIMGPPLTIMFVLWACSSWRHNKAIALATLAAAMPGCILGAKISEAYVGAKIVWRGGAEIAARERQCPSREIRVPFMNGETKGPVPFAYSYMIRGTGLRVVRAKPIDVSQVNCQVVGWAEHLPANVDWRSEGDVLRGMMLTNSRHIPIFVIRDTRGLIVIKSRAALGE